MNEYRRTEEYLIWFCSECGLSKSKKQHMYKEKSSYMMVNEQIMKYWLKPVHHKNDYPPIVGDLLPDTHLASSATKDMMNLREGKKKITIKY